MVYKTSTVFWKYIYGFLAEVNVASGLGRLSQLPEERRTGSERVGRLGGMGFKEVVMWFSCGCHVVFGFSCVFSCRFY